QHQPKEDFSRRRFHLNGKTPGLLDKTLFKQVVEPCFGLEKVGKTWLVSEYVQAESWRDELSLANKLKRAIRQASVCP
ncbi:MAG: hypothetical protein ACOVN9_08290, partial [Inhella sp.]